MTLASLNSILAPRMRVIKVRVGNSRMVCEDVRIKPKKNHL